MKDAKARTHRSTAGMTVAEILIALAVLALGLAGILALFPAGQKLAAATEEKAVSTVIAHNYASIVRWFHPTRRVTARNLPFFPERYPDVFGNYDSPCCPVDGRFFDVPFRVAINTFSGASNGNVLDSSAGLPNYEVSVARRETEKGEYSLTLIVVHRIGSPDMYHFLVGHGFDDFPKE